MTAFKNLLQKVSSALLADKILLLILALAFMLRIAGIGYGLPLWLIDDEPPFILGALQMIQLKTVLPFLHPDAFAVLYYAPYLSYLYVLPFIASTAVQYILWHGGHSMFAAHLLTDLSAFFEIARTINVLFALASIFLLYRVSLALFNSRRAALASAFLLATSITYIGSSMVARHWIPTTFFFILSTYLLVKENWPEEKRYFWILIAVGVGIGFDTTAILALIPAFWWFFTNGRSKLSQIIFNKRIIGGIVAFIVLAILPTLLHPMGNGFLHDVTVSHEKSLWGLASSPSTVFSYAAFSEPVLMILFLCGILYLCFKRPSLGLWVSLWFLTYVAVFYLSFRLEPRFFLPLVPLYALVAGLAFDRIARRHNLVLAALAVLLLIPAVTALRFSQLVLRNDTREVARQYAVSALAPQDKVIVYASLTRLPGSPESTQELRSIDPSALRKVDQAEEALGTTSSPYALNLYTLQDHRILNSLDEYAKAHQYGYFLYQPGYADLSAAATQSIAALISRAQVVRIWEGSPDFSLEASSFTGAFWHLYREPMFGPEIILYKIH